MSGEKKHPHPHTLERRVESFSNLREFRRKDSAASTTSSLEALDFLADMCVEIDEIGTGITTSPSIPSALLHSKDSPPPPPQLPPSQQRKLFSLNSRDTISSCSSTGSGSASSKRSVKNLKRECSQISPHSRSSLTPASAVGRTLSKGYSFSSVGSGTFGLDHSDGLAMAILNGRSDSVEDRRVIPLTLYQFADHGIYLLPTNPTDIDMLVKGAEQANHNSVFTFSLTPATPSQHVHQVNLFSNLVSDHQDRTNRTTVITHDLNKPSPLKPSTAPSPTIPSSSPAPLHHIPPSKLINPKHIYKTSCDTYRVQMSKGSKTNPNGKFSRNTRNEVDALWLCEYALLLVERPNSFEDILMNGNYKCLLQRNLVSDPTDFATKLLHHMNDLSSRGLLKPAETDKLTLLLPKFLPQYDPIIKSGAVGNVLPLQSTDPLLESPLSFSLYTPTDLPNLNPHLPNSLPNKSFFPESFQQPNNTLYPSYLQSSANPPPSQTVALDADQKKRRRGGQTPVMTQRYHSYPEESFDSNLKRTSSASPVFLQAPPTSTLSLTSQNLSQVNKLKPYRELSLLTSQYVRQKSRSFEDTNDASVDDNVDTNQQTSPTPPQLRKFV